MPAILILLVATLIGVDRSIECAKRHQPADDPDDLEALIAAWEEERSFGAGFARGRGRMSASCRNGQSFLPFGWLRNLQEVTDMADFLIICSLHLSYIALSVIGDRIHHPPLTEEP